MKHSWSSLSIDALASADANKGVEGEEDYSPTTTHSTCSSASIEKQGVTSSATNATTTGSSDRDGRGGAQEGRRSAFGRSETSPFIARSPRVKRRLQEEAKTDYSLGEGSGELEVPMPPLKCAALRRPAAAYPSTFRRAPTVVPACAPHPAHSLHSVAGLAQGFCPILPERATCAAESPQRTIECEVAQCAPAAVSARATATSTIAAEEAYFSAAEIDAAFRCVSGTTVCSELSDGPCGSARASPGMDELLIFSLDL
jgi:hypothetical protein